ncbi:MAG TPA: hypothetical protein VH482_10620 [Thermomicrobiales bacterium]
MVATRTNQHDLAEAEERDEIPGVRFVTAEEGRALFDREARALLGISGEAFLRGWDRGDYGPVPDTKDGRKLGRLVMLIPFARRSLA